MKHIKMLAAVLAAVLLFTACGAAPNEQLPNSELLKDAVEILLSDDGITANAQAIGPDNPYGIYAAHDIVYYESGKNFTYGEGSEADAHSAEEAASHTVLHITKPGAYSIRGKLSLGQIAVDLGEKAKEDPNAVVTLILNGVDITCNVAPAVIFYNVYECASADEEKASKDVDTSAAGANVIITDGTVNNVRGSYVARIYKPDSVVLNEDKTEVADAKKLHKYDGAFYSKQSINIFGGKEGTGILHIQAENEGLDSELHLTIHGGNIQIESGNDGINTNEDGISVTTVNGGNLLIKVTGETGEGDGIDSNGWLVINGGTVIAAACSDSADAGIDSDMGIHINGGTVTATGHMLDRIEDGGQNYAVFNFAQRQTGSEVITMKNKTGKAIMETKLENGYSILIYSSPELKAGTYTLWSDGKQLAGQSGGMVGGPGMRPDGMDQPWQPGEMQPPQGQPPAEGMERPNGQKQPDGSAPPEGFTPPDNGGWPQMPEGGNSGFPGGNNVADQERTPEFTIRNGENTFSAIVYLE